MLVVLIAIPSRGWDTAEVVTPCAIFVSVFFPKQHYQCYGESANLATMSTTQTNSTRPYV